MYNVISIKEQKTFFPNCRDSVQIDTLQIIGHALLSKTVNTLQSHLIAEEGIFSIFKNYLCKLPIGNTFSIRKNSNVSLSLMH